MATTCEPGATIVPLTSDRTKLKDAIDGFKASGTTAGQLGTAFAWYLLSPNWSDVWRAASAPAPYGTPKVKKIAILMTDGEYNTLLGKQYSDGSAEATTALNNAKTLCTGMKQKLLPGDPNIEIYTVGFKLTTKASKAMLKNCATSDRPLLRDVVRRRPEGGVPRHRLEDLAPAADELTPIYLGTVDGAPATAPPFLLVLFPKPGFNERHEGFDGFRSLRPIRLQDKSPCPGPAASAIRLMIDVPPTVRSSRVTRTLALKRSAHFTNLADARA